MTGTTVAVFGDIGGHVGRLEEALVELGADPAAGTLPDGLTVIQVGDLVHKGPDSDAVIALVERFRQREAAWVQLAGNHEAHYLGGPQFWGAEIDDADIDMLKEWDRDRFIGSAAAVTGTNGTDWLITHAGLVDGTWNDIGSPERAADAADALNDLWRNERDLATAPGLMLGGHGGGRPNVHVSVTWAEPTWELYEGWSGGPVPFSQVHGHASAFMWGKRRWSSATLEQLGADGRAQVNRKLHHTTVRFDGGDIVGIDAQYGRLAERRLRPHIINGAITAHP